MAYDASGGGGPAAAGPAKAGRELRAAVRSGDARAVERLLAAAGRPLTFPLPFHCPFHCRPSTAVLPLPSFSLRQFPRHAAGPLQGGAAERRMACSVASRRVGASLLLVRANTLCRPTAVQWAGKRFCHRCSPPSPRWCHLPLSPCML